MKLLFTVFLAVLCVGCAPKPESPKAKNQALPPTIASKAKLLDPCSLLSAAEAAELLGEPAATPKPQGPAAPLGIRFCHWSPASDGMGLIQIGVLQSEGLQESLRASGMTATRLFRDAKAQFGADTVPGLGDDAYYNGSDLMILKNGVQLSVSAGSRQIVSRGEQGLPAAKRVAEKVLSHLNLP
jgi:hypothetical protein